MPGGKIDILVEPELRGFAGKLGAGLETAGRGVSGVAANLGKALSVGLVAGTAAAAIGLKQVIDVGVQYQNNLNTLQAVTGATGAQMGRVGEVAKALGADMTLPATSAADAAAAMLELSKGGLTVDQAMTAAKGTLQLAAAAQIDAAQAAQIQSAALNQFGLAADQAGHVADVLANTANAAAGEITDMGLALKYVGPVARTMGISIDDTATAVGLLANNGILGETAGTALRGMLASLAAPSKAAANAMHDLGIVAFDQQGKFVGLRAITDQLAAAKGRMSQADFTAAAATAFGREPLAAITALASEGAPAFDEMAKAVSRQGGAAEVAAAKTKGLGGAMEGFKSQAETVAIGIFQVISGPLEQLVRVGADAMSRYGQTVVDGLQSAIASAQKFGPQIVDAVASLDLWRDAGEVIGHIVDIIKPVGAAVVDAAGDMVTAGGAAGLLAGSVEVAGDAASGLTGALVPVGQLVGGIAQAFANLPAPVQAGVLALVAFRLAKDRLADTAFLSPIRQFSDEMRVQQGLAAASGQSIGRYGAALAAFETSTLGSVTALRNVRNEIVAVREGAAGAGAPISTMGAAMRSLGDNVPFIGRMRDAFDNAAAGADGFAAKASGAAAAVGSGLRSAVGGLIGALGGPWGLAIGAAVVGLGFWADSQAQAAQKTREHQAAAESLGGTLNQATGAVTQSTREEIANQAAKNGMLTAARGLGISTQQLVDALSGERGALDSVNGSLTGQLRTTAEASGLWRNYANELQGAGITLDTLQGALAGKPEAVDALNGAVNRLGGASSEVGGALNLFTADLGRTGGAAGQLSGYIRDQVAALQQQQQRVRDTAAALGISTGSAASFGEAMKTLTNEFASADDKARALNDALRALDGGERDAREAAGALLDQLKQVDEQFHQARDAGQGLGTALLDASGKFNINNEAARGLDQTVFSLRDRMYDAAQAAFDSAGGLLNLAGAQDAARQQAVLARDQFIASAQQLGFTRVEAENLANAYGIIPDQVVTFISNPGGIETEQQVQRVHNELNRLPPNTPVFVEGLTAEAVRRIRDTGATAIEVSNGRYIVTMNANTGPAQAGLNDFMARNRGHVITVLIDYVLSRPPPRAPGAPPLIFNEQGSILKAFAPGGFHKMTPMRGGLAQMVPPNTWRLIGDRSRDDEAYIPINRSTRSLALLEETARRMGYNLLRRYADGGINAQLRAIPSTYGSSSPPVSSVSPAALREALDGMAIDMRFDSDGLATLVNKSNARKARR